MVILGLSKPSRKRCAIATFTMGNTPLNRKRCHGRPVADLSASHFRRLFAKPRSSRQSREGRAQQLTHEPGAAQDGRRAAAHLAVRADAFSRRGMGRGDAISFTSQIIKGKNWRKACAGRLQQEVRGIRAGSWRKSRTRRQKKRSTCTPNSTGPSHRANRMPNFWNGIGN